jgi:hypothetical protein
MNMPPSAKASPGIGAELWQRGGRAGDCRQGLDWHEARLIADGFDQDTILWRQQGLKGSKQSSGPG